MSLYASLVAAQLGLDEKSLTDQALIESEEQARDYHEMIKILDEALKVNSLYREPKCPGMGTANTMLL